MVYLDANFMGLWWGHLHLFDGERLPGFPGNSCLALDDLKAKENTFFFSPPENNPGMKF